MVQIRDQGLSPNILGPTLIDALLRHWQHLEEGAILTVDVRKARVRNLPLR